MLGLGKGIAIFAALYFSLTASPASRSVLTMVGGKVAYADQPFAGIASGAGANR